MHFVRLWLLLSLVQIVAIPVEEFAATFGAVDPVQAGKDPELVSQVSPFVSAIEKDSLAARMGLQVGDCLVGIDGLQVVGLSEWNLARFRNPARPEGLRITVLRRFRITELFSPTVMPGRRVGFSFSDAPHRHLPALRRIGFVVPGDEVDLVAARFPRRAALSLLRWHAHRGPEAEDTTWVGDLAKVFAALVRQQWAVAAAMPPVAVPETCPDLQRLARFYQALARRHADGEQPPDPQLHGEGPTWFTIHYPYPQVRLPELGAFTHPDPAFIPALQQRRLNPGDRDGERIAVEALAFAENEPQYVFQSRIAVIDPDRHGGWPFRHKEVYERGSRPALLKRIDEMVAAEGPQADWARFTQIQARLVDAGDRQRPQALDGVLPLIAELRRRSPLLGYLALDTTVSGCRFWDVVGVRDTLRSAFAAGPLPQPDLPSRFLDHLRAHEAGLTFHRALQDGMPLVAQLDRVHASLSRPMAFADLQRRLADPGVAMLPVAERLHLMELLRDYVRDVAQPQDIIAMARLALPGAMLQVLADIADGHAVPEREQEWIRAVSQTSFSDRGDGEGMVQMASLIGGLPWNDATALSAQAEAVFLAHGNPRATLVLADACAAHGHPQVAEVLRERVRATMAAFSRLADHGRMNRGWRRWFQSLRAGIFCVSPATADLALDAGDLYAQLMREGEDWEATWLCVAQAALARDQTGPAVEWLARSFSAGNRSTDGMFWMGGELLREPRTYRTRLLEQMVTRADFTPAMRSRLIQSAQSDRVDQRFADLLGVPHKSLTGGVAAPGANDF